MPVSTNRATGKAAPQAGDMTALRKVALEEERDAEAVEQSRLKSLQAENDSRERKNTVVDYTGVDVPLPEYKPAEDDDAPVREFVCKYAIEKMAFGMKIMEAAEYNEYGQLTKPPVIAGVNYLDFEEGRRYRVPTPLYRHLDERGFVLH